MLQVDFLRTTDQVSAFLALRLYEDICTSWLLWLIGAEQTLQKLATDSANLSSSMKCIRQHWTISLAFYHF